MRIFATLALAISLASCGTVGDVITGQVVNPLTPKIAYQLQASIDVVTVAAGSYARLPRCSRAPQPCSEQSVVGQLRIYVNAGQDAAHKAVDFAVQHPNLDGSAIYDAAVKAINAAKNYAALKGVS
jgi:hypothetical protein